MSSRKFERLTEEESLEALSSLFDREPEIPPKKQEGGRAGSTPKITNNQVWPPTEPPLAEGIKKKELVSWV
jgi:hypothetical protein